MHFMLMSAFELTHWGFPSCSVGKEFVHNAGDLGLIPESERSRVGGHGNPLQYSCLENPTDRGAWQAVESDMTEQQSIAYLDIGL